MLRSKKVVNLVAILTLVMLLTACGTDEQTTMQPQEETVPQNSEELKVPQEDERQRIDYLNKVNRLDRKIRQELVELNLRREVPDLVEAATKNRQISGYNLEWIYNKYQLQVPLFGAEGRLLADYRTEIIKRLETEFEIIEQEWQKNEAQQQLILKIGFAAKNKTKLISHELVFSQQKPRAKMAIIIDDFGFNRQGTEEILEIERPLTAAVLPFRPYAKKDARLARQAGLEVLLHQPLEPLSPEAHPGVGAIYTNMSQQEIKAQLLKNLNSLLPLDGINHHMGSKASANERVMKELLKIIKKRDLYYIDSSTSQESVGAKLAQQMDIPTAENHLFIDNVDNKIEIKRMLAQLAQVALNKGELLIIGHVKLNTADAIEEMIPKLEEQGIKLVYVSQLLD